LYSFPEDVLQINRDFIEEHFSFLCNNDGIVQTVELKDLLTTIDSSFCLLLDAICTPGKITSIPCKSVYLSNKEYN
jgi:hypothetical protein